MNEQLDSAKSALHTINQQLVVLNDELLRRKRELSRVGAELLSFSQLEQLVADAQLGRAEAERANCAKDDFLATLSHELRTPLSSMLLNAQLLSGGHIAEPAELRRAGEALERATWLQVKLVDDLLDVSRLVTGKVTLDSRPVDLCGAVQASLDSMSSLIEAKKLVLQVSLAPALDLIWADRVRVQQVVSNLLTNAIKFTPHGGQLTVKVEPAARFARVSVSDTGVGIEPEYLPHVFSRFSQSDGSITRKYGGLGLGLAIVRQLVELHGGTVQANSRGKELGASFCVTFPFAPAPELGDPELVSASSRTTKQERPAGTQHGAMLAGVRVLFVDDDLRTREAVLDVLQLAGASVELAANAADGRTAIDAYRPHVILCDIAMPGEDGYTFIRTLRASGARGAAAIPALALTALAADEDRRRALSAGFQLHLAKPIDIERLRDSVLALFKLAVPQALTS